MPKWTRIASIVIRQATDFPAGSHQCQRASSGKTSVAKVATVRHTRMSCVRPRKRSMMHAIGARNVTITRTAQNSATKNSGRRSCMAYPQALPTVNENRDSNLGKFPTATGSPEARKTHTRKYGESLPSENGKGEGPPRSHIPYPLERVKNHGAQFKRSVDLLFVVSRLSVPQNQSSPVPVGTALHTATDTQRISTVQEKGPLEAVYNLVVADFQTYFVGQSMVLSHDVSLPRPTNVTVPGLAAK